MELRHIGDPSNDPKFTTMGDAFKRFLKEAKRQKITLTMWPVRFGEWQVLGQDDAGAWLSPTFEEVNSKPRKR